MEDATVLLDGLFSAAAAPQPPEIEIALEVSDREDMVFWAVRRACAALDAMDALIASLLGVRRVTIRPATTCEQVNDTDPYPRGRGMSRHRSGARTAGEALACASSLQRSASTLCALARVLSSAHRLQRRRDRGAVRVRAHPAAPRSA